MYWTCSFRPIGPETRPIRTRRAVATVRSTIPTGRPGTRPGTQPTILLLQCSQKCFWVFLGGGRTGNRRCCSASRPNPAPGALGEGPGLGLIRCAPIVSPVLCCISKLAGGGWAQGVGRGSWAGVGREVSAREGRMVTRRFYRKITSGQQVLVKGQGDGDEAALAAKFRV